MPLHAGRSLRKLRLVTCHCMQDAPPKYLAWSHAAACRTLPDCASLGRMQRMQGAPWEGRRRLLLSHCQREQHHPPRCSTLLPLRLPYDSSLCSAMRLAIRSSGATCCRLWCRVCARLNSKSIQNRCKVACFLKCINCHPTLPIFAWNTQERQPPYPRDRRRGALMH